jgi:hypothetical protein
VGLVLLWKIEVNPQSSFKKIFSWNPCGIACFAMCGEWSLKLFSIMRSACSEYRNRTTPLLDEVGLLHGNETF